MTAIRPIRTHLTRGALALFALLAVAIPALVLLMFAPAAGAAQQNVTVPISNFAFSPADLTIHTGDTVTWVNQDRAPHNVTSTNGPASFASSTLKQGQSFSYTFSAPGTYSYACTIHPDMVAAVTVMGHDPAPAAAPPPVEEAPQEPEQPADAAPADEAPADEAPAAPPADAAAVPVPAPAATPSSTPAAPQTTQVVGAAQQGRQLDPLLIVAGVALGVTTLCLLLISAQPTSVLVPASSGTALGAAAVGGQGPATATMAAVPSMAGSRGSRGSHYRDRELVSPFLLRVLAALGLAVDGYVHFALAADYDTVGDLITQGLLFRVQGTVALLAALLILLIRRNLVYQAVFLVAISALVPVVLYTYVDVGAIGPLPNMYEPVWYLDKTISAIGEAVAAVAAGLLGLRPLLQRRTAPRHTS